MMSNRLQYTEIKEDRKNYCGIRDAIFAQT